jgi:hypothetical protein
VEFVTKLSFAVQITGAVFGVLIVLVGFHLSALQDAKQQGRTISAKQQSIILSSLSSTPKGFLSIWFDSGDPETYNFAVQIRDVLTKAGYTVVEPNSLITLGTGAPEQGVIVGTYSEREPEYGQAICVALEKAGIPVTRRYEPASANKPRNFMAIEVHRKP